MSPGHIVTAHVKIKRRPLDFAPNGVRSNAYGIIQVGGQAAGHNGRSGGSLTFMIEGAHCAIEGREILETSSGSSRRAAILNVE